MLEALYDQFPTHRSQLREELPGALPLQRHLRRLANAGASPAWVATAIGQPLGGLTSVVAGLTARARLALQRWDAEKVRAQQVAEQRAAAAAAAAQRAREQAAETARWTRAATAAAALPADLRSKAESRIAGGLLPPLRTEANVRRHLHAWCDEALERAMEATSRPTPGGPEQQRPRALRQPGSPRDGRAGIQPATSDELGSGHRGRGGVASRAAPASRSGHRRTTGTRAPHAAAREAQLHGWCARALERAEGQPLADLLLQDLAASVDLTASSHQPAA